MSAAGWLVRASLALGLVGCGAGSASDDGFGPVFQQVTTDSAALSLTARTAPTAMPMRGVNTVRLHVSDAAGAPAAGLTIVAVPFMPDMGHGASVKPTVIEQGGGVYDVESVALPMAGHWTLRLTLNGTQTGAHDDAAQLSFQVP